MPWTQTFDNPITLPDGRTLRTLRDAANYITKVPDAEHPAPECGAAIEGLILVAETAGDPMLARIGVMSGLNRHHERAPKPVADVPELSTWAMMILGFLGLGYMMYFRRSSDNVNKLIGATVLFAIVLIKGPAGAAILETTKFISSPTYFNGFEGFGTTGTVIGSSYSEGGITVSPVQIPIGPPGPSTGFTGPPPIGSWNAWSHPGLWWYAGGYPGYVDITLTNGATFQSLQFLASSEYIDGPSIFEYQRLNNGMVVGSGSTLLTAHANAQAGGPYGNFQYLGSSGGGFDDVRLQAIFNCAAFACAYNALALDDIAAGNADVPAVPEPSTWAMH
jgi:hypothetical protein